MPTDPDQDGNGLTVHLDSFESAWQQGKPQRIDDVLDGVAGPKRRELLIELILLDMEYRWQQPIDGMTAMEEAGGANNVARRPLLDDYVAKYPQLGPVEQLPLTAILHEYRVRKLAGDGRPHSEYLERFSADGRPVVEQLQRIDFSVDSSRRSEKMRPRSVVLKVFAKQSLAFVTELDGLIEVGRQRKGEPSPYCRQSDDAIDRLIVAAASERHVSRTHTRIELINLGKARVVNCSGKQEMVVNEQYTLQPGCKCNADFPAILTIGELVIRMEMG